MNVAAFVVGAVLEAAVIALASPTAARPHGLSRRGVLGAGLLTGAIGVGLALFTDTAVVAPFVFVALLGFGLGVSLRVSGRLPLVNESAVLVATSLVWLAIARNGHWLLLGLDLLAALVALPFTAFVLYVALGRRRIGRVTKAVHYVWFLLASAYVLVDQVLLDILPAAWGGDDAWMWAIVGGATLALVSAVGVLVTLFHWEAQLELRLDPAYAKAGYVPEETLFPERFTDERPRAAHAWLLLLAPLVLVALNRATDALPEGVLVALLAGLLPLAGRVRERTPAVATTAAAPGGP